VILAIAGAVAAIASFVLMQMALNVRSNAGSAPFLFHIVGLVLFLVWLASIVATIVGIVGTVARSVRQRRSG